ncbi:MAG: ABC transporter ATP-binding protein [Verrucomicrobiota bacterium]
MVKLHQVTKRFGDFVAVEEVDLAIGAGEFLTLLGPSGCGKTTLLRMIAGFEIPTSGQVFLQGEDVTRLPPYERDVNQVFQSYALFPHLTVEENIGFGLRMKKVAKAEMRERIAEVIDLVALGGMERRRPNQLSGGQRQRVALARAIVCRPKVLLLDEPLSALDAQLRKAMQIELKRLQKKLGITFVFVTHDQEEALTMSDRIAVVNGGRIEQIGTTTEIYHAPATAFVARFIGMANIFAATVLGEEAGMTRLGLGGGVEVRMPWRADRGGDGKLSISIRPEKIHLQSQRNLGESVFEAEVVEEHFKGATNELLLRTAGGVELMVIVANESASEEAFHQGARVWCGVNPQDIVVVRGEQSER